jgi:hypothetical protein
MVSAGRWSEVVTALFEVGAMVPSAEKMGKRWCSTRSEVAAAANIRTLSPKGRKTGGVPESMRQICLVRLAGVVDLNRSWLLRYPRGEKGLVSSQTEVTHSGAVSVLFSPYGPANFPPPAIFLCTRAPDFASFAPARPVLAKTGELSVPSGHISTHL